MSSYFRVPTVGTSRNPVLFGVQAVNSNLAHHQVQKVALVVEREVGHAPFKGQQGIGNDLLVGHDTLFVRDVDLHLLNLPLQFVLLLGQVFRRCEGFLPEMSGSGLAGQHEVALKLLPQLLVAALELAELDF